MNKQSIWLLAGVMATGVAQAADLYPVKVTTALPYLSRVDAGTLLTKSPPMPRSQAPGVVMSHAGVNKKVVTCSEYLGYRKKGFTPQNNAEMAAASYYINYCIPLYDLTQTKGAKISNLRDFDLWTGYQGLPADIVMPNLSGDGPKGTFIVSYPNAKVKFVNSNEIQLTDKDQVADVTLLAWGDYNGDGIDDMMLTISHYTTGGTYKAYDIVWVTRKSPTGAITEIKDQT